MKTTRAGIALLTLLLTLPAVAADLTSLRDASTEPVSATLRANGLPAFVRGTWIAAASTPRVSVNPAHATGRFIEAHATDLGLQLKSTKLVPLETLHDRTGRAHVRLAQTHRGVPVYGAQMLLHYLPDETTVYALNGRWAIHLEVDPTPKIGADLAVATASAAMPAAMLERQPSLVVVTDEVTPSVIGEHLAWEVVLTDPAFPARQLFLVDAHDASILSGWNLIQTALNRTTYDAQNLEILPGILARSEGDGPVGDLDVDNAHDFAGATYDHFLSKYGRDSLDGNGGPLFSTAHYGAGYQNAFWNGFQMVYGDGFTTLDVCAHELAHGVTERTSDLIYLGESGALNESFSDIFGALIDDDDWLVGEDLPIGAIRSLSDPTAFGDPAHMADFLCTDLDNGGVHTNSGIQNKAAYLLATSTSRDVAGQIFYRSLTFYLFPAATYIDGRDAAINAAVDLYGVASSEVLATVAAMDAVGLDAAAVGPDCPQCLATATALSPGGRNAESRVALLATAYRVRDELLEREPAGRRLTDLYYRLSPKMVAAAVDNPRLFAVAIDLFSEIEPGLRAMLEGRGKDVHVRPKAVSLARELVDGLAQGDPSIAREFDGLKLRTLLDRSSGKSFAEAWGALSATRELAERP